MKPVTHQSLGIAIAYLIPGFAVMAAISLHLPPVHIWLGASGPEAPTVGGFLYITVASLATGLFLNSTRGLVLDPLYHRLGVRKNAWDYSRLQSNLAAVEFVLAYQYRYYQFTGNMFLAALFAYPALELAASTWSAARTFAAAMILSVLFFSARRLLDTYYRRLDEILGQRPATGLLAPHARAENSSEKVDQKGIVGYDR